MFQKIMCPVDLAHKASLEKALRCAGDLARHYACPVVYVGVTAGVPGPVAHTPAEYSEKLAAFARAEAAGQGITAESHAEMAHDPTTEVDDALIRALATTGADLVVMASHVPNVLDYVWPSNGGKLAEHAHASVMLIRG